MIRSKTGEMRPPLVPGSPVSLRRRTRGVERLAAVWAGAAILTGCITVNAPEDAIVIELNINIRQEVIYRLAEDAGNTIEENADIF